MLLANFAWGQSNYSDSLVAIINKGMGDSIEVDALVESGQFTNTRFRNIIRKPGIVVG
jgi:hypothetical protein